MKTLFCLKFFCTTKHVSLLLLLLSPASVAPPPLLKRFIFYLCVSMCHISTEPVEARRGYQIYLQLDYCS